MIVMLRHTASMMRGFEGQPDPPVPMYSAIRRQQSRMCIRQTLGSLAGMALQWHSLVENPAPNVRMDGIRLYEIHVDAEQGLKVDRKSTRLNSSHLGISYAVF